MLRHLERRFGVWLLGGLLVALPLGGCQTSEDPAQGGFFSGLSGLSSGAYERRLQSRQAELVSAQQSQTGLRAQTERAHAEQAEVKASLAKNEREMQALQNDVQRLRTQLAKERRQQKAGQNAVGEMEREVEQLGAQLALLQKAPGLSDKQQQERLNSLKQRYETLNTAFLQALE